MPGKLVVVYYRFGPYQRERLRALIELAPNTHGLELTDTDFEFRVDPKPLDLGGNITTLSHCPLGELPSHARRHRLIGALEELKPTTVLLGGYLQPELRHAASWARTIGVRSVLWFVSTAFDKRRRWWREWFKRRMLRRYDAVATTGARSQAYLTSLGVENSRIAVVGNVVGNRHFESSQAPPDSRATPELDSPFFLAVSRLAPEKNLEALLRGYAQYRSAGGTWGLLVLGEGPERDRLSQLAHDLDLRQFAMPGWRDHDELPPYYAACGGLVLPSVSEPWGLVVNEAMAAGKPCIVSDRAGCAPDLVEARGTGLLFPSLDPEGIAEALSRLGTLSPTELTRMGARARRVVSEFTPRSWAQGILALQERLEHPTP